MNNCTNIFILEWTKLVWTPALGLYTGMDKTSLDTSSKTLFVSDSGRMSTSFVREDVHVTSNVITCHCSALHNRTSSYVITYHCSASHNRTSTYVIM